MSPARHAASLMRQGKPPALAVYLAAQSAGIPTRNVARALRRPARTVSRVPVNAWWNR
jgi:hypothetical protein